MNPLTKAYREIYTEDTRPDDVITLDIGKRFPELLEIPAFGEDYDRIQQANAPGILDKAKQAYGSLVRGVADVVAGTPEAIGIGATALADKTGIRLGQPDFAEDTASYQLGQAIRAFGEGITPEDDERLTESFWATKVPQGLGSALGFMLGGGLGGKLLNAGVRKAAIETVKSGGSKAAARILAGTAKALPVAGLGATTSFAGTWKEAKAHGANDDDALTAALLAGGVGTSEVWPVMGWLNRLDRISGGGFKKALIEAGKETVQESLQEAFQTFAGNAIAQGWFDKDRKLLDDLAESAAAGGVTGAMFSMLVSALGGRLRSARERAAMEQPTPQTQVDPKPGLLLGRVDLDPAASYTLSDADKAQLTALAQREVDGDKSAEFYEQLFQATIHAPSNDIDRAQRQAFYQAELARLKGVGTRENEFVKSVEDQINAEFERQRLEREEAGRRAATQADLEAAAADALDQAARENLEREERARADRIEGMIASAQARLDERRKQLEAEEQAARNAEATQAELAAGVASALDEASRERLDEARRKARKSGYTENAPVLGAESLAAAEAGEFWKLLPDEYLAYVTALAERRGVRLSNPRLVRDAHERVVRQALIDGKDVAPDVLAFYPDLLAAKQKGTIGKGKKDEKIGSEPEIDEATQDLEDTEPPTDEDENEVEIPDIPEHVFADQPSQAGGVGAVSGTAAVAPVQPAEQTVPAVAQTPTPESSGTGRSAWETLRGDAEALIARAGFGTAQLQQQEAGVGKRAAQAYLETNDPDDLTDLRADKYNPMLTRMLGVFQARDGSHVMVATVYRNKKRKYVSRFNDKGQVGGRLLSAVIGKNGGYNLIGAIKTDEDQAPLSNHVETYSPDEWLRIAGELRQGVINARNAAAAAEERIQATSVTDEDEDGESNRLSGIETEEEIQVKSTAAPEAAVEVREVKSFTEDDAGIIYEVIDGLAGQEGADWERGFIAALAGSRRAKAAVLKWVMRASGGKAKDDIFVLFKNAVYDSQRTADGSKETFARSLLSALNAHANEEAGDSDRASGADVGRSTSGRQEEARGEGTETRADKGGQAQTVHRSVKPGGLTAPYSSKDENEIAIDPRTGTRSAIAASQVAAGGDPGGRQAAPGSQGLRPGTADRYERIRRRTAAAYQRVRGAYQAFTVSGSQLTPDFISQEVIDFLRSPGKASTPEIQKAVEALQALIPVIPKSTAERLRSLRLLEEGAESEVFLDESSNLVYKLLFASPNLGRIGDGYTPGTIYEDGNPETAPTYLSDFLARVALNNAQGGMVLSEVVGITPDGRLVLVQPYIEGLSKSDFTGLGMPNIRGSGMTPQEYVDEFRRRRGELLRQLGLVPFGGIERSLGFTAAVGWADGKPIIVDDLHDGNLMVNAQGQPFIIDAASRELTEEEANLPSVRAALEEARGLRPDNAGALTEVTPRERVRRDVAAEMREALERARAIFEAQNKQSGGLPHKMLNPDTGLLEDQEITVDNTQAADIVYQQAVERDAQRPLSLDKVKAVLGPELGLDHVLDQVIGHLESEPALPEYRAKAALARMLKGRFRGNLQFLGRSEAGDNGDYDWETDTIRIFVEEHTDPVVLIDTILHETVHAFTVGALHRLEAGANLSPEEQAAAQEIKRLYEEITARIAKERGMDAAALKRRGQASGETYGFTDIFEFASEAMTNKDFQVLLAGMKSKAAEPSLWQRFVTAVRRLVASLAGLPESKVEGTQLEEVLNRVSELIEMYDPHKERSAVGQVRRHASVPWNIIRDNTKESFNGRQLQDVIRRLEPLGLMPNVIQDDKTLSPLQNIERLSRYVFRWFSRLVERKPTTKANDGAKVILKSDKWGTLADLVSHLTHWNSRYEDVGRDLEGRFNPNKARMLPLVETTLENAQLRLRDPKTGNYVYVAKYADGTVHAVFVEPTGHITAQGPVTGRLVTQFDPTDGRSRARHFLVERDLAYEIASGQGLGTPGAAGQGSVSQVSTSGLNLGGPSAGPTASSVSSPATGPRLKDSFVHRRLVGRQVEATDQPVTEVSPDLESTALATKDVAAQNAVSDALEACYHHWASLGHNPAGLTFQQWLESKNFVDLHSLPDEIKAVITAKLHNAGHPMVRHDLRIPMVQSESMQKRAAAVAHKILWGVWSRMSERRRAAEWNLSADNASNYVDALAENTTELAQLVSDYTNADRILQISKKKVRILLRTLKQRSRTIAREAFKKGELEQVIEQIEGKINEPLMEQYEKALNQLYTRLSGDLDTGRKFVDLLEAVANMPINWATDPVSHIRGILTTIAPGHPLLGPLASSTVDSKALLSIVIAFGKRNSHIMDALELRRSDAIEERQLVNEALKRALEHTQTAYDYAHQITRKLDKLARVADRLLTKVKEAKREQQRLLDAIHRERTFIDFHQDTALKFREQMAQLEAIIGASSQDWEPTHGAEYMVPPSPTADILVVEATAKKFSLSADGMLTDEVRQDMLAMLNWLNSVPHAQRGATWAAVKAQYDKLSFMDISHAHNVIQGSWVNRLVAPITEKLRFVGTPAAMSAAVRFERMGFWIASKIKDAQLLGTAWERAEGGAMAATGIKNTDKFRSYFYTPALSFIEKRQDILASHSDLKAAENAAIQEVHRYFMKDPETARMISKPGAWAALVRYYRATASCASWMDETRKEMGLKIKDTGGEGYEVYRESIGAPPFTVMRGFSNSLERTWLAMKDAWTADDTLKAGSVAEAYTLDPQALRAALAPRFTPQVWSDFVRPLVYRAGRSAFYAPAYPGDVRIMAEAENVKKAFEAAQGDPVAFAEWLYRLEGSKGDIAEYVGETLETFQNFFASVNRTKVEAGEAVKLNLPVPPRFLADARRTEEWPTEWLDYHPYSIHDMRQLVKLKSYEASFGRGLKAVRADLDAAHDEQLAMAKVYQDLQATFNKTGKALRDAVREELKRQGLNPTPYEEAQRNAQTIAFAKGQLDAMLAMQSDRPPEISAWAEIIGTLSGLAVAGPATAFTDTIAVFEQPFRKLGFSTEAFKQIGSTVRSAGTILWGSLLQSVGQTTQMEARYVQLLRELGHFDDDASLTLKSKLRAVFSERTTATNPLMKGAVYAARTVRAVMSTGVGQGLFPTFKPHSLFTYQAQIIHAAEIMGWWKRFEALTGEAVSHFEHNPFDVGDPAFRFKPEMLGHKPGRTWDSLLEYMARYGFSLETVAREAYLRRQSNPNAALLTKDQYRALAMMGQNEVTLETSMSTRPPQFMTNPVLNMANPLLGWAIDKAYDAWRGFREPDGKRSSKGFRTGLLAYAAILPIGLAYAFMRDEYDEEILGKKQNVLRIGTDNAFLAILDSTARVGTFGLFGEIPNNILNVQTQREFSLDNRIFFVNSMLNFMRAVSTWVRQEGVADWQTVYRPLLQSLGGSGYLQYADGLNNLLGLDNAEARVTKRIGVSNYLRTTGRGLNLDVRSASGMKSMPTPIKPYIRQMELAAYANDAVAFREAYMAALKAAREEKKPDPADYVRRSFSAYHPLRMVFRTEPSEAEYQKLLMAMTEDGREAVATAVRLFNSYAEQIGATGTFGRKTEAGAFKLPQPPSLEELRRRAASY
jgi:hypothetical protein